MATIFLTSGTSWTVPSDWANSNNTIECIGAGGSGAATSGGTLGGGGGGAYAKVTNLTLTIGASIAFSVGAGGGSSTTAGNTGGNTFFNGTAGTGNNSVQANGGGGGTNGGVGAGGTVINGSGFAGGAGGAGGGNIGGGGGAAAGKTGAGAAGGASNGATAGGGGGGADGGTAGSGSTGGTGAGGGGNGGTGGISGGTVSGADGAIGTEWDASHGSGGGGGGGFGNTTGGAGALYGAGGGGTGTGNNSGAGAQGLIVITYAVVPASYIISQLDWPNPRGRTPLVSDFFNPVETQLISKDQFFGAAGQPPPNTDWPNPRGYQYPSDLRTFVIGGLNVQNLNSSTLQRWMLQYNWPVPKGPEPLAHINRNWDINNLIVLIEEIVHNQYDWPVPKGPKFSKELRTWLQNINPELLHQDQFFAGAGQGPHYDWPNPKGHKRPFPYDQYGSLLRAILFTRKPSSFGLILG